MGTRKTEKTTSLIISCLIVAISIIKVNDWHYVGIYAGCPMLCRIIYPFFHANCIHALLNVWCFLSVVFIYNTKIWKLFFSYLIGASIPIDTLNRWIPFNSPTVGLSGVIYALFGMISFDVARKLYYQCWMAFYIVCGFFFPNTNAWLHLYCYAFGFLVSLLTRPITLKK